MRRFRFSLLSLIVAVLLMSGMLYVNLRPSPMVSEPPVFPIEEGRTLYPEHVCDSRWYGWPFTACSEWFARRLEDPSGPVVMQGHDWHWHGLVDNLLLGFAIAFAGSAACEWLIRRRAKKAAE